MERKKFNILSILVITMLLPIKVFSAEAEKKTNPLEIAATVRVLEQASRVELGSEKIKIFEGQANNHSLKMGKTLRNYTILIGSRRVNLNNVSGYLWIEARLLDDKKNQIAYVVTTTSQEKFSIGTGFVLKNNVENPLVLMIDNM